MSILETLPRQPELNIGTLGHVDNGKSTLVQALTGIWTAKHSEELRRGITIRVGYADVAIYKCPKCLPPKCYTTKKKCPFCNSETEFLRAMSFVDCPGHHSLMITMLAGAALMDGALLVIAANAECPQPQDREHLAAAEIVGIKNIVVVQNKIDVVDHKQAIKNYHEILDFIKGTVAEDAPIVPVSAQHATNMDILIEGIQKAIPTPKRDITRDPRMYIVRSFDVNKPGKPADQIEGGVIGGSILQGEFRVGNEIEIAPGIPFERGGKTVYQPLNTKIVSLHAGGRSVKYAQCGGLVGVGTLLDPSLTKADGLVGNIVGKPGTLPEVWSKISLDIQLFERAIGTEELKKVERIRFNETLVLNLGTAVTAGRVSSLRGDSIEVELRRPVCAEVGDRATISRRIGEGWRLIGYGRVLG